MKKVIIVLVSAILLVGCKQNTSSPTVSTQEKLYSESEVNDIKESVAESIRAEYEPSTSEMAANFESETQTESIVEDPWENGTLTMIGLEDMPKPNDSYQAFAEAYNKSEHDPVTGNPYTIRSWEIMFSDSLYQDYKNVLIAYLLNKCPYMIGQEMIKYENGTSRTEFCIVKSTEKQMGYVGSAMIHVYENQVYFITFRPEFNDCRISIQSGKNAWGSIYNIGKKCGPELDAAIISYINQL